MEFGTKNIVLIGMPGCGKSSVGLLVSKILDTEFYDLDQYIEEKAQTSIPEIFKQGEEHFRQIETNAVRDVCQKHAVVISTGGGIVTRPENMTLLAASGTIFYIDRPLDLIVTTADLTTRPLLAADHNRIYKLYQERKHLYEQYCHYQIINTQTPEMAAKQIVAAINQN